MVSSVTFLSTGGAESASVTLASMVTYLYSSSNHREKLNATEKTRTRPHWTTPFSSQGGCEGKKNGQKCV